MAKKNDDVKMYHLSGKKNSSGFSGRGVRLRTLSGSEVDKVTVEVAKESTNAEKEFDITSFMVKKHNMLAMAAITEVTIEKNLKSEQLMTAKWHKITDFEKSDSNSGWTFDDLFTAKDQEILSRIMRTEYEIDAEDANAIINFPIQMMTDEE